MATTIGTTGNDNLLGTADNDSIMGLAGNDTINGGLGVDIMVGGVGDDFYYADSADINSISDEVKEDVDAGIDTVFAITGYHTLSTNVENLYLQGSSIDGFGNELNNYIAGNNGNNRLWGGMGIDTLAGGLGYDIYYVNSTSDVIIEGVGANIDTVYAISSYTLGPNVENLYLEQKDAYYGYGNELNNYIAGTPGNNYLWGSAGIDTLAGGSGNDTYSVDSTYDVIIEGMHEYAGTETVYAYSSYTLSPNVENLYLLGSAYYGYGNALNNYIAGNSGNNYLWGAAGIDTMAGGLGSDRYDVNDTTDVIIEGVDAGTDIIYSYASYTLSPNVENLYLSGSAYYGYGNALNNRIWGNAQNNYLWGAAGVDTMQGGLGSDRYDVNETADVIIEGADAGIDIVYSYSVSYTLSVNVENLQLVGSAYYGGGNELNNRIWGNADDNYLSDYLGNDTLTGATGNDTLAGGVGSDSLIGGADNDLFIGGGDSDTIIGGVGSDSLIGGTGADYFSFYSASEGSDTIIDINKAEGDKVTVLASGFGGGLITTTGVTPGELHSSQFVIGATAADLSDRIIYNSSTGALFFDVDGTGANVQVQIASLSTGLALTNNDIQVF